MVPFSLQWSCAVIHRDQVVTACAHRYGSMAAHCERRECAIQFSQTIIINSSCVIPCSIFEICKFSAASPQSWKVSKLPAFVALIWVYFNFINCSFAVAVYLAYTHLYSTYSSWLYSTHSFNLFFMWTAPSTIHSTVTATATTPSVTVADGITTPEKVKGNILATSLVYFRPCLFYMVNVQLVTHTGTSTGVCISQDQIKKCPQIICKLQLVFKFKSPKIYLLYMIIY